MSDDWPYAESANVSVILPDIPTGDWRDSEGYGWIVKAWFNDDDEAAAAHEAISRGGWTPERRRRWSGRKVRVPVATGQIGDDLVRFVLQRWPNARIQLRND